jgi:hypothetical protein
MHIALMCLTSLPICPSQVKHGVLQRLADAVIPGFSCLSEDLLLVTADRRSTAAGNAEQELVQVTPPSLTSEICVISRGNQADGFGSPSKHVADGISESLEFVSLEADFVMNNIIMGRSSGTLQTTVSCME